MSETGLVDVDLVKERISIHSTGWIRPHEAWELIADIETALSDLCKDPPDYPSDSAAPPQP